MTRVSRALRATYWVEAELALVAIAILAWQAVRIPLEGSVELSPPRAVRAAARTVAPGRRGAGHRALLHADGRGGSRLAVCERPPPRPVRVRRRRPPSRADRYPPDPYGFRAVVRAGGARHRPLSARSAPLADRAGTGRAPSDAELGTSGALFHNSTAAAASQHFGFAVFVAAASIWLFRALGSHGRRRYPALVFVVIVGTGNHYVLDCVVGTLTFVLAAFVAFLLHERPERVGALPQMPGTVSVVVGYVLVVWVSSRSTYEARQVGDEPLRRVGARRGRGLRARAASRRPEPVPESR